MSTSAFTHLCVFCGSAAGNRPEYTAAARDLGRAIAARRIHLVYGGGSVGLMGEVANAALSAQGSVTGVITRQLHDLERGHKSLTNMHIVPTMHERKAMMADLSHGFIILPGGYGTLDELFEIVAWAQLGIHARPIGLVNTSGYYDRLMEFLDHSQREGFLRIHHREHLFCESNPAALVDRMLTPSR